jgi:hypothetical protein
MRRPSLVPSAIFAPGTCMICGGNEGQMVDTGVDIPGDGRMYLCTRLCVPLIVALVGQAEPERICTATKVNGQPCSAKALPGRDLCPSHLTVQREKEEKDELVALPR